MNQVPMYNYIIKYGLLEVALRNRGYVDTSNPDLGVVH